jgi:hypothetical protein
MITISYNYSSNDFEFLEEVLNQANKVTDDIQISYVNKFFDGKEENLNLIEKSKLLAKERAIFNEIKFDSDIAKINNDKKMTFKYWHNITRFNNFSKAKYDYILFLDGDEIIDGDHFKDFLCNINIKDYNSYIFNVYWYFRSKRFQATTWEEGPVMTNKNSLNYNDFMSVHERWNLLKDPCARDVKSLCGKPLIHHYSWAKGSTEEECKEKLLKKIESWGHSEEVDWRGRIEEEFSRPFNGKDFVHNYSFIQI